MWAGASAPTLFAQVAAIRNKSARPTASNINRTDRTLPNRSFRRRFALECSALERIGRPIRRRQT
ncbi:DUF6053 domain-containing protein [Lysobacter capsici]|uniref:DUF6053 domain-containing protein n=1 Tax=Lysobacter capsici TaxID=435897 RepID=UPI003CCDDDC0